ncbi:universal stress protein [Reyranella sp.]|uniref:universal stress protein n=1 Tax=Reyranella sp. TaxID=1929291 RepID=UPI0011F75636|nr:universal stress protein [Reyranella sp.]TAJ90851.1 MAG: universal stress protein [Reyranella sp.]
MGYKTILVHCDAAPNVGQRLVVAAELAQRYGAHLVGVHARPPFEAPVFFEGGMPMDSLFASYEAGAKADAEAARAAFDKALKGRHLSHEWRTVDGFIDSELAIQARYADLTIVGQTDPDAQTPTPSDLPEAVVLATGRPMLIVPHVGVRSQPGERVMLCWNASRESARAAADALPLLQMAKKVIVLVVDPHSSPDGHGAEPGADVAHWLARHGVDVTVQRDVAADSDVGGVVLSRAADHDIDLVVMGLYGHSRVREMILGGASRTLLSSMTVPLFVSH